MRTVAFHWSGGKDSALALTALLDDESVVVDRLVTTVNSGSGASTVHGIPVDLLHAQADSVGLPLQTVTIPGPGLNGYVEAMDRAAAGMRGEGIDTFAFGDLSSSGVLRHKRTQFEPLGIEVLEPLWGLTSHECVERFLASGIRAITVVVDAAVLGPEALGLPLDHDFFAGLPPDADPYGELGEFHSFAHEGPIFRRPVDVELAAPRRVEQQIRTTDGVRTYAYWLATPRSGRIPI